MKKIYTATFLVLITSCSTIYAQTKTVSPSPSIDALIKSSLKSTSTSGSPQKIPQNIKVPKPSPRMMSSTATLAVPMIKSSTESSQQSASTTVAGEVRKHGVFARIVAFLKSLFN